MKYDKIRKLVLEADAWCDQHWLNHPMYDAQWELKFAELIVKECADIALREDHDPYECILKHFGVE